MPKWNIHKGHLAKVLIIIYFTFRIQGFSLLDFWYCHYSNSSIWYSWQPDEHPGVEQEEHGQHGQPLVGLSLHLRPGVPPLQPGHEPHSLTILQPLPTVCLPCLWMSVSCQPSSQCIPHCQHIYGETSGVALNIRNSMSYAVFRPSVCHMSTGHDCCLQVKTVSSPIMCCQPLCWPSFSISQGGWKQNWKKCFTVLCLF